MIAFLNGTLVEKTPSLVVLDVGGVGYEVFISLSTYDRLPASGSECRLLTHQQVRDDAHLLYGFATPEEKRMFGRLITISGIGPKLAISILSGLTVSELTTSIAESDVKRISSVRGIGKKTAERLIIELRDKIDPLEAFAIDKDGGGAEEHGAILRDTILALGSLGYSQDQARKWVQVAYESDPTVKDVETLLKRALSSR